MLQQTRVEAVKDYYARFMEALPTVEALAFCEEERLLKLWEGLGYYSRARNLQKTAKIIVNDFDGVFPSNLDTLKTLPGIGAYTAGAIASIAFYQPTPAIDGNVFRVCARLEANDSVISSKTYRDYLENALSAIYPKAGRACADLTQSLFELGALICKPQNPDCQNCPLNDLCEAKKRGAQALYPVLPPKKEKRREEVFLFLIETPSGFCIRRRERGVLKGMNEFPSVVVNGESMEEALQSLGIFDFQEVKRRAYRHIFTHIIWEITCVWVRTESAEFDAYSLAEIEESISLPTAFKQCLTILN